MNEMSRELALAKKYRISNELAEHVSQSSEKFAGVIALLSSQIEDPLMRELADIGIHVEHFILDIHLAMVSFEGCAEGSRLQRFAAARVIHSLYELNFAQRWFFKKVRDFAVRAGLSFDFPEIRSARKKFAQDLKVIDSWGSVRNYTTGHYDSNANRVSAALDSIDVVIVRRVVDAQVGLLRAVMDAVRTLWWERYRQTNEESPARSPTA